MGGSSHKTRLHNGGVVEMWLSGRVMVSGGFKQLLVGHQIDGVKTIDVDGAQATYLGAA